MAAGDYEAALPVAVNAVKQGQAVYKPATSIQLFPLYLLAAQVRGLEEMIPSLDGLNFMRQML
jgi:hypothetical protein